MDTGDSGAGQVQSSPVLNPAPVAESGGYYGSALAGAAQHLYLLAQTLPVIVAAVVQCRLGADAADQFHGSLS